MRTDLFPLITISARDTGLVAKGVEHSVTFSNPLGVSRGIRSSVSKTPAENLLLVDFRYLRIPKAG